MAAILRTLLALCGVTIIAVWLLHLTFGPGSIPGSVPVNATMDSEDRFFSTMLMPYGLGFLWCSANIYKSARLIQLLSLAFFAGGLARLVSIAVAGLPHIFFIWMTAIELILPLFLLWLSKASIRKV